jgi:RHS repeat-associated protein
VTQSSNSGEYAVWDYWPFGEPVSQFDFQAAAPELAPEALCTAANPLFCDGFESGNLLAWTCTNGQGGCVEPDWELFEPLFTGKKQDAVTDLFYFEARFMDAKLGRFVSPDEGPFVLENPQTFNRYAYAVNSPFRYGDPNGESPTLISGAVGFVAGGLVGGLGSIGVQLWNNGGSFSDINWRDVGASSAGGAISGGLAGLTLGGSLAAEATLGTTVLASTAVGAATNPVGGAVQRALDSSPETRAGDLQAVAADAAWGAVGGAVGGRIQAGYNARILQAEAQVIASIPAASRGSWGAAQSINGHATIAAHAQTFGPIASNVASSKVTGVVAPMLASSESREEPRP